MENIKELATAYRKFLLELGHEFKSVRDNQEYEGYADTFVDFVKSPEIGFNPSEATTLIKLYDMFCLLESDQLPSHHNMKLMLNKGIDMGLLESAQTLTPTDFKELIKDEETGTQQRTYRYEIIKRCNETGNIKRVYEEELPDALKELTK